MTTEQTNEEFGERAAIREYDGLYPKTKAEQLAAADLLERKREAKSYERKKQENSRKSLQEERDQIGKKMRAEKDPTHHRELFNQWTELCGQIIEARKGV